MKAVALTGIRKMGVIDVPQPAVEKPDDVLLRIAMVGVCGSDVHYYETGEIGSEVVKYPFVLGHECAATVAGVGTAANKFRVGDRIAVEPAIVCHKCDQCKAGRENTCRNLKFLGCPGQLSGAMTEYIVMPEDCCFAIPENVTFPQAVLCEPLAIAVYAVRQSGLKESADVGILGAGPIGLSCLVAAQRQKARTCYLTDKIKERVEVAARAGATWVGNPDREDVVAEILNRQGSSLDVVFECAGQQETLDEAVELLRPGGKLMLIGIPQVDRISFIIGHAKKCPE